MMTKKGSATLSHKNNYFSLYLVMKAATTLYEMVTSQQLIEDCW